MADDRGDDRSLVRLFLSGRSEASFRALYHRLTPRMYRIALRLVDGDVGKAEDAVQEAWIRAVRRLDRFEWRASLSTWLVGFVVNVVRESWRTRVPAAGADPSLETGDTAPHDVIEALSLSDALAGLPDGYRNVLTLHDVGGFTHEEIAAILGIDPGTSKSQLARARRRVRDHLGAEGACCG